MNNIMNEPLYKIPENCDFSKISNNRSDNECSPILTDQLFSEFKGLLINGPNKIVWPSNVSVDDYPVGTFGDSLGPMRVVVAGLAHVENSTLGLNGKFHDKIILVAINQDTAETFTGKMTGMESMSRPQTEDQGVVEVGQDDSLVGVWFNIDLVYDVGIPIVDAVYTVYAVLGEYRSNVVVIKTVLKK